MKIIANQYNIIVLKTNGIAENNVSKFHCIRSCRIINNDKAHPVLNTKLIKDNFFLLIYNKGIIQQAKALAISPQFDRECNIPE